MKNEKYNEKYRYMVIVVLIALMSSVLVESVYAADNITHNSKKIEKNLKIQVNNAEEAMDDAKSELNSARKKLANYKEDLADLQKKAKSFGKNTNPKKVKSVNDEISRISALIKSQESAVAIAETKVKTNSDAFATAEKALDNYRIQKKAEADALKKAEADAKAAQKRAEQALKAEREAPKKQKRMLEDNLDKAEAALKAANKNLEVSKKKLVNSKEDLADLQKKAKSFGKNANPDKIKKVTDKIQQVSSLVKANESAVTSAQDKVVVAKNGYNSARKELLDFVNNQKAEEQKKLQEKSAKSKSKVDAKVKAQAELLRAEKEYELANARLKATKNRELTIAQISKAEKDLADAKAKMNVANATLADAQKALAAEEKNVASVKNAVKAKKATVADLKKAETARDLAKANVRQMKSKAENLAELNKHTENVLKEQKNKLNAIPVDYVVSAEGMGNINAVAVAEDSLFKASENLANARHAYNMTFQKKATYVERSLSEEELSELVKKAERRSGLKFAGDVSWFASVEVNGDSLLSPFISGMPKADAVKVAKERAIDAGFYLVGIEILEDGKTVLINKGSIGNINVEFGKNYLTEDGGETFVKTTSKFFTEQQIKNKFGEGKKVDAVEPGKVFNFTTIQNRFYDLNAHPDIARADIKFTPNPDATKRALDVNIFIEEDDDLLAPAHFIFGVDNFGSMDGADEWMARGTVQLLNLWHSDHALTVNGNYSLGGSLFGVAGSYYIPRLETGSWYDLAWTLHGGYTDVDTEDVVPAIDVEGKGYFGGLQVSKRLVDRRESSLDLSLGLTYRYVDSALVIDGEKWKMGKDGEGYEILPLSLALIYTDKQVDSWGGRNYATIEAVHNVGGSSLEEMQYYRATIDDEAYTLLRAQVARIQLLGDYTAADASGLWMLFAKLDSQFADGPLNGAEQFGLGGHGAVRGYDERQFMADSGVSGTFEVRTPLILGVFDRTPNQKLPWDRMQFVGFFDYGWYNLEDGLGEGKDDSEFICSVGLGLRFVGAENAQLRLDWGIPLIKDDEKFDTDSAGRIHLSMQLQF